MAEFTASEVIPACRSLGAGRDGDTFKVKNGWKWDNKTGDTVRPCLRAIAQAGNWL